MFPKLRKRWGESRREPLGQRFRRLHALRKESAKGQAPWKRVASIVIGIVLLAIAAVLAVMPGPAFLFAIPAFTLLGTEFLWVAKFLDACERRFDPLIQRATLLWKSLSRFQRRVLIGIVIAFSLTAIAIPFLV